MLSPCFLRTRHRFGRWAPLALALSLLATPAWSAPGTITFEDTLRLATDRAPMLAARHAQIVAAREEAGRAAALPDPRLRLGLANWPVTGPDAFDLRADDMTTQQIGVMQEFPARAKRRARQAVADAGLAQAQTASASERAAVRQAVAVAWITLWATQQELQALQDLREPASVAVRTARARLAGGTGTATDTLATQAAVLALENRIDATDAAVQAAAAGLARWLGMEVVELRTSGVPPALTVLPVDERGLLTAVDRLGPVLPWASRQTVAEAEVDAAIAQRRPDWSLELTYGRRDRAPNGMPRSDMLMVEFAIDLPLFTRNRQSREIAARRADLHAVMAEREDARRAQIEAIRRTVADWRGLQRQVARQKTDTLPLARDRAKTALAAYAGGADLQPWLEARRDEIELYIEHARLKGELGRAWAALAYLLPEEETVP